MRVGSAKEGIHCEILIVSIGLLSSWRRTGRYLLLLAFFQPIYGRSSALASSTLLCTYQSFSTLNCVLCTFAHAGHGLFHPGLQISTQVFISFFSAIHIFHLTILLFYMKKNIKFVVSMLVMVSDSLSNLVLNLILERFTFII